MRNIFIVADDLTGACDTGIKFRKAGWDTTVLVDGRKQTPLPTGKMQALAVNTDTRSASPEESFSVVKRVLEAAGRQEGCRYYKKIDSVLRGNIQSELEAFFQVLHNELAIVAPAVPENGRRVRNGILYLGQEDNPDLETDALEILRKSGQRRCRSLPLDVIRRGPEAIIAEVDRGCEEGVSIFLADTWDEEDLHILAKAIGGLGERCVPAGSAGLAQYLAELISAGQTCEEKPCGLEEASGALLVVVGTRHPVTAGQIRYLRQQIQPETYLLPVEGLSEENMEERVADLCSRIPADRTDWDGAVILLTTDVIYSSTQDCSFLLKENAYNRSIKEGIGLAVQSLMERIPVGGLIATGGDISAEIFGRLKLDRISLCDEPIPGIVTGLAAGETGKKFLVATKSGGFGNPDALLELCRHMQRVDQYLLK